MYYALIVDLIDSKKMDPPARQQCQRRLKAAKDLVNDLFRASDLSIEFSSGDSLQGFTADGALALRAGLLLACLAHPARLHCGIGRGELYVIDRLEGTNASDGPAFHDAARALEQSKARPADVVAHLGGDAEGLIAMLLDAAQALRLRNTERQNWYAAALCALELSGRDAGVIAHLGAQSEAPGENPPKNDAALLARIAGTSVQNVRQALRRSCAREIYGCYAACLDYLAR
ncbi:MAG: hypothetical protein GX558_08625 [Clostridiales bacterium]|nr:hypothetical protein [Clostridiales bacterium]